MSHEHVYEKLKIFKENNNIPNIIFHGSSGSGKKTILFYFLHTIYENKQCIRTNVMVVNCSHGKGIRFIRDDLKMFAKTNMNQNIQFKSIILLNADSLTNPENTDYYGSKIHNIILLDNTANKPIKYDPLDDFMIEFGDIETNLIRHDIAKTDSLMYISLNKA